MGTVWRFEARTLEADDACAAKIHVCVQPQFGAEMRLS